MVSVMCRMRAIAETFEIVNARAVGAARATRNPPASALRRRVEENPGAGWSCDVSAPRILIRLDRIDQNPFLCLSMICRQNASRLSRGKPAPSIGSSPRHAFPDHTPGSAYLECFPGFFSLVAWKIDALASASASFDDAIALSKSPASAAFFAAAKAEAVTVH